jgi:hypothetical protein
MPMTRLFALPLLTEVRPRSWELRTSVGYYRLVTPYETHNCRTVALPLRASISFVVRLSLCEWLGTGSDVERWRGDKETTDCPVHGGRGAFSRVNGLHQSL